MSRIGNKSIPVLAGVDVKISGNEISVKGPKGALTYNWNVDTVDVKLDSESKEVVVTRNNETRPSRAQHGLTRSLIDNMIVGCANGWSKELEIRGTGYRGAVQGKTLNLNLGYSHPINYDIPEGITINMPDNTKISVTGADKQLVGQVAADIRSVRPPEPYKGKGIKYSDEEIVKKEAKKK